MMINISRVRRMRIVRNLTKKKKNKNTKKVGFETYTNNVMSFDLKNERSFIFRYFSVTSDRLQHLVSLIKHKMQRLDTKVRISVPAKTHLAIILRYSNSGESQQSLT